MAGRITQFLGDSPARVLFRLLVLSFVVGLVLSTLNIHPLQVWDWLERLVLGIWNMGFAALEQALSYLLLGALVVVPVFLVMRLLRLGERRSE